MTLDPTAELDTVAPPRWLGGILFGSVLFMLNATMFFTLNTGMDMYGFYTLEPLSAYPLPLVLSTLLSCVMAVAAYLLYRWLCLRRAWFSGNGWGPFTMGAVLSGAPVFLAYAPGIVLTSVGGKPNLIAVAVLTAGSLCVTHALWDPEINLDPDLGGKLLSGAIAAILVFLALSISGMLVLHYMDQQPAHGNFLWKWEFEWSDLGYLAEEFPRRQREALVLYTLTGSGFMIAVLGGSMLGAILKWTRMARREDEHPVIVDPYHDTSAWVARIVGRLESLDPPATGEGEYVAVLGGQEIETTGSQYQRLVTDKDDLLRDVELFVDKVVGSVFLRAGGMWNRLDFRIGDRAAGIRSGPFSLLCIYARHPGQRFTNAELRMLLDRDLSDRASVDVGEFISQLRRRKPRLPVDRDEVGSFLDDSVNVCFLDYRQSHGARGVRRLNSP